MKFLHTADWQLGMKASHLGHDAASRVREERLSSARRVINTARNHNVEFLLIAGDTFEDNAVERGLIQKVADILASSPVPVYIIPGNHDPLTPGSVWEHPAWKSVENVHVLRDEKPVDILGGIIYPCPIKDKHSRKDPTAWIPSTQKQLMRIGIAHGTVEGVHQSEPDYPIPRDAALRSNLDYLALGHWHSTAYYSTPKRAERMAYSGTHETTSFGERDSGNVLIVDIPSPGSVPVITAIKTGNLKWKAIEIEIMYPGDLASVREVMESEETPELTLISVKLKGLLHIEDRDYISRIREILESRFLFSKVDSSGLHPSPRDTNWIEGLPPGILQNVAARLQQLANPQYTEKRPEGASPETASRALLELYAMISEVSP